MFQIISTWRVRLALEFPSFLEALADIRGVSPDVQLDYGVKWTIVRNIVLVGSRHFWRPWRIYGVFPLICSWTMGSNGP